MMYSSVPLAAALTVSTAAWAVCPAAAAAQDRWRLSPDPTVEIGSTDGSRPDVFHHIRGVVRATDGVIVVADGGSTELRVFTGDGRFVRSFWRPGNGPRELRHIGWIDMCGGREVVAYDSRRKRITKWDTDGSLVDDFVLQGPRGDLPPYSVTCGRSGKFAVVGWPDDPRMSRSSGPYRPTVPIGVADDRGRRGKVIGEFPGEERLRLEYGDRPHPFGRSTMARPGVGGVYVGTADSFAIHRIAPDGERRTFGREHPTEPLSRDMLERWVDAYLERAPPEQRPSLRRRLLNSEYSDWLPTVAPAYDGFWIERLGFVWVRPYAIGRPAAGVPVEWSVFGATGAFVATVDVPGHFRPMEIGEDYVLGVSTDGLDVERVRGYTLFR